MAGPTTRTEFSAYCLRKLGAPVINIEIDQSQVEDRIDDALQVFQDKHYDATEEKWVYYEITQLDVNQGYIQVPDNFLSVIEVLPASTISTRSADMFSFQYQIMVSELNPWEPFDSIDYFMKMMSIDETRNLIDVEPRFKFIRHKNQLKIYQNYEAGTKLIFRVFEIVDPDSVWNDKWLKAYTTALIKLQWGNNVSKFAEVQLLGGVTISGERLIQEALAEIELLTTQLNEEYQEPVGFIFG